jgi:hypothetical protein
MKARRTKRAISTGSGDKWGAYAQYTPFISYKKRMACLEIT